jgi:hypothetical protein
MSDFAERIRNARTSTNSVDVAVLHPELPRARPRLLDSAPATRAAPDPGPTLEELEAQRRRVAELTRKVDELNAAIVNEILRHPDGLSGCPRTVAALARNASPTSRAQD